jgi:hypothetical protein
MWRREQWDHRATGHPVVLHWEYGDGRRGLGRFDAPIGVFFHRGDMGPCDDPGEGSSGSHWLSKEWLEPVLERLIDGGFVVTDGSCGREYPELRRFDGRNTMDPGAAVQEARPFETAGRVFTCVGHAGMRYGPTLVWEVRRR